MWQAVTKDGMGPVRAPAPTDAKEHAMAPADIASLSGERSHNDMPPNFPVEDRMHSYHGDFDSGER